MDLGDLILDFPSITTKLGYVTNSSAISTTELTTDWRERAACAGHPNQAFFPVGDGEEQVVKKAKAICAVCPVSEECLQYALETNQRFGIWAGTTEAERRSIRRKWLAARRRAS